MTRFHHVYDTGLRVKRPLFEAEIENLNRPAGLHGLSLCSACLVGGWLRTLLRSQQHICTQCIHLGKFAAHRFGGTWSPADRVSLLDASVELRAARLTEVFDRAESAGLDVTTVPEIGRRMPLVDYLPVVGESVAARARRFVEWVQEVSPERAVAWDETLADVDGLTWELRQYEYDANPDGPSGRLPKRAPRRN